MAHYGVSWDQSAKTITLYSDGVKFTLRPESAFNLVIMAARMLRGYGVPYPYTLEETERIALADVRRHLDDVAVVAAEAGPMFDQADKDEIRDALDSASATVDQLNRAIEILRSRTGTH